jgi:hypothetical protein
MISPEGMRSSMTQPAGIPVIGAESGAPAPAGPGRRRIWIIGGLVLALVLSVGLVALLRDDNDPATAGSGPNDPPRPAVSTKVGVFRGTEPAEVTKYEEWLGRKIDLVVDFSTRQTWAEIAAPDEMIQAWKDKPYRQVYSVGLLPEGDDSATIERGAAGEYDVHYRELAGRLVAAGQQDAILRLGWEFNLESSRWQTDDEKAFIEYWRRVVAAMRAEPGQKFQFDWNPNNGKGKHDAVEYYPGNDVVDFIGVDAYDVAYTHKTYPYPDDCDQSCRLERQKNAWRQSIYGDHRGLRFWSKFAAQHGKPMSLPEWGLWKREDGHGGGENAYYLQQMAAFIADPKNAVAYHSYFEFDGPDGPHRLMVDYPDAGNVFRPLFSK